MNDLYAKQIIQHLVEQGVRRVCLSPGSRSTPLALALAQEERLEKMVHFDERGAGFHAYGYAKGSKTPVALIVTSGTAVANLFPAVMEAALEEVPLIVITADRPPELRDCGANQTCDQVKLFGNYVRWYGEIPCADSNIPVGFIGSTLAQAVYRATHAPKGPVHINCLFREPFLSQIDFATLPSVHYEQVHTTLSLPLIEQWAKKLSQREKGVIVVGSLSSPRSLKSILALAEALDWPLIPDILSGVRSEGIHSNVIPYHDLVLQVTPHLKPETILHLGDRLVSKQTLQWIEHSQPSLYLMVNDTPTRNDPSHLLTHRIQCDPPLFCEQIISHLKRRVSWLDSWKTVSPIIEGHIDEYIPPNSEPGLIRFLHHHLPPHYALFLGNSMPIRDANNFFFPRFHRGPIFGKRGTSGIDGNIASVIGLAEGLKRPTVAILGDQTALHDLNSLAQLQKCKVPVTLLVVNNFGGGIFSFLPAVQNSPFCEDYFAAAHAWNFEHAAHMFKIPYIATSDPTTLRKIFREEKSHLVEFRTNRKDNFLLHKEIAEKIKHQIGLLAYATT